MFFEWFWHESWICWFDLSLCRCAIIFNFLCGWRATLPFSMLIDCILPPNFFGCLWVHTDSGWSWNSIFASTSRVNSLAQLIVRAISESFSCFPNSSLWYWAFQVARRDFSALRHSSWFAYLSQYSVSNNQIVYLFVSFVTVLRSQSHGATRTLMHESGCLVEVRYFLFNICQQATQLPQVTPGSRGIKSMNTGRVSGLLPALGCWHQAHRPRWPCPIQLSPIGLRWVGLVVFMLIYVGSLFVFCSLGIAWPWTCRFLCFCIQPMPSVCLKWFLLGFAWQSLFYGHLLQSMFLLAFILC